MFPELPDAKIEIRNPIAAPSGPAHLPLIRRALSASRQRITAPNFPHHRIAANTGQRRNSENVEIVTSSIFLGCRTLSLQRASFRNAKLHELNSNSRGHGFSRAEQHAEMRSSSPEGIL
jgi:hypothetical protein